ncbi:MAG: peptidyl-prolyl cis-trans isomerase [Arcobacteraceae bacterium]|jgi:peptidylprolyl isomerase|nr:peptidyl-prolyl cis-trans isomerase [Arcobacteraceae bacterium]
MKFLTTLLIVFCLHASLQAKTFAIVNGEEINAQEVDFFMRSLDKEETYEQLSTEEKNLILHQVIEKKLLIQEAKKEKLQESKAFQKTLDDLKNNLLVEFWMKKQFDSTPVTKQEIEHYYQQHIDEFKQSFQIKARHIVVETSTEADAIIDELNATKTDIQKKFIDLANEKSLEPTANTRGGDLGWFKQGDMLEEFWQEAMNIEPNHYSKKPLQTPFGYHVLFVDGKKPSFTIKLEQVYGTIKNKLQMERFQQRVDETIKNIKKNSQITVIK